MVTSLSDSESDFLDENENEGSSSDMTTNVRTNANANEIENEGSSSDMMTNIRTSTNENEHEVEALPNLASENTPRKLKRNLDQIHDIIGFGDTVNDLLGAIDSNSCAQSQRQFLEETQKTNKKLKLQLLGTAVEELMTYLRVHHDFQSLRNECGICFSSIVGKRVGCLAACRHVFCFDCLQKWRDAGSNTCPKCRKRDESVLEVFI